jgi:hypothetical protein
VHAQNITVGDVKRELVKFLGLNRELVYRVQAHTLDADRADRALDKCPSAEVMSAYAAEINRTHDLNLVAKVYAATLICNRAVEGLLVDDTTRAIQRMSALLSEFAARLRAGILDRALINQLRDRCPDARAAIAAGETIENDFGKLPKSVPPPRKCWHRECVWG